jgi:cardiolipin synthase
VRLAERFPERLRRDRQDGASGVRRWAWPAAVTAAAIGWYAADSLRHRREGAFGYDLKADLEVDSPDFVRAAEALTGAPISDGNDVELLINGDRIFPAMLETIRSAQRTLTLETYVYWKGDIAREVAGAVCERAQRGVRCHLILDALGSGLMERDLFDRMVDSGVRVLRFRPPKPYAVRRLANRTHRRLLVADGRIGMTGGVGIAREWTGNAEDPDHWRDTHVRVRGPIVRGMQGCFAEHWLEATGEVLGGDDYLPDLDRIGGGGRMQLVRSRSTVGDTNVEAMYYLALASASRSIDLTAAYFVPRPAFTEALSKAARRDVQVRVLVPGAHTDKQLVRTAGQASYTPLLDAGVRIFEYAPTMLHAKTMVVDGAWSSVGTVNFDNRSFQLHDEVTLCVWSDHFAGLLSDSFEADLERSDEIHASRWRRRGLRTRAGAAALKPFRREL